MNSTITDELNIILNNISQLATSEAARSQIKNNLLLKSNIKVQEEMETVCQMAFFLKENYEGIFDYNYDLSTIIEKLDKGYFLLARELLLIKHEIELAHKLKNLFKNNSNKDKLVLLAPLFNSLFSLKELKDKLCNIINPNGEFQDNASLLHQQLIDKKTDLLLRTQKIEKQILKDYQKYTIDNNIHLQEGRKTILIDISQKGQVYGNIIGLSSSGKAVFVEPKELINLNNELVLLNNSILKEEERIFRAITKLIVKELSVIINNQQIYLRLDMLFAKAKYAIMNNMEKVTINNDKQIILKDAYQPLIDKSVCVPINFTFTKEKSIYIITGANAGGKTVAMKTVYLIIEMAKRGLLLPCNFNSSLYLFEHVYFDIGDNQSITNSLSTFQSHIKSINNILNNATLNDLVIMDELGSGTSPIEGQALAISILDYLQQKRIKTIVSTHFPEVKRYATTRDFITCACVSFDKNTLQPNYKLIENQVGQSYGIDLSKKFGLLPSVVNKAREILSSFQSNDEKKYQLLDEKLNNVKKIEEDYLIKNKELTHLEEQLKQNYEKKIASLDKEYFDKFLELENEINRLKSSANNKVTFSQKPCIKLKPIKKEFKVGDMVYVIPYKVHAPLEKIEKKNFFVKVNGLLLNFTSEELTYSDQKNETNKKFYHHRITQQVPIKKNSFSSELDLRGKRYIEVTDLIESKISDCLYAGINTLLIITGYGKGDVRKATIAYLKKSKYVKEFNYAGEGSGLMGAIKVILN